MKVFTPTTRPHMSTRGPPALPLSVHMAAQEMFHPTENRSDGRPRLLFVITSRFAGGAQHSLLRLIGHLGARHACILAGPGTDENRDFLDRMRSLGRVVAFDAGEPKDDNGIHLRAGRFVRGCWRTLLLLRLTMWPCPA